MPIRDQDQIVGAVEVFTDDVERHLLKQEMAELSALAREDALTELPNRRYGETYLEARLLELKQLDLSFGVVLFDLDHFKEINDRHGHDTGDRVLKTIGRTLKDVSRQSDCVVRWGGEEFLMVASEIDRVHLLKMAERMRILVQESTVETPNGMLSVTVSAGAALAQPGMSKEQILKQADQALYLAKERGRNRVVPAWERETSCV